MDGYRIPVDERVEYASPAWVDGVGLAALACHGRWHADAFYMLINVYVDETGSAEEPRFMLAAFVARLGAWHKFSTAWKRLLDKNGMEYSHATDSFRGKGVYEGWTRQEKARFNGHAARLVQKHVAFGVTVSIDKKEYREYRNSMPPKTTADSMYGLCMRSMIQHIPYYIETYFPEKNPVINFICESGCNGSSSAVSIMRDLRLFTKYRAVLGALSFVDKRDAAGLQAADISAFWGRRAEPTAKFGELSPERMARLRRENDESVKSPVFRIDLGAEQMAEFKEQSRQIAAIKRRKPVKTVLASMV